MLRDASRRRSLQFMRAPRVSHGHAVCILVLSVKWDGKWSGADISGARAPWVEMRDGGAIEDVHLSLLVLSVILCRLTASLSLERPIRIGAGYNEADKPYNRYCMQRSHLLRKCRSMQFVFNIQRSTMLRINAGQASST
jgi:hypothetical protein